MNFNNRDLDRAMAVADSVTVRPDGRCFGRLSPASGLQEITPRVAQALHLAQRAAPQLQRRVLLARKMTQVRALGAHDAGSLTQNAAIAAFATIAEALRAEIETVEQDLRVHPPTAAEREFLEAAAFGSYG